MQANHTLPPENRLRCGLTAAPPVGHARTRANLLLRREMPGCQLARRCNRSPRYEPGGPSKAARLQTRRRISTVVVLTRARALPAGSGAGRMKRIAYAKENKAGWHCRRAEAHWSRENRTRWCSRKSNRRRTRCFGPADNVVKTNLEIDNAETSRGSGADS